MDTVTERPQLDLSAVVDRYVKLRDRKSELKKDYDKDVEDIDKGLAKIEAVLLRHLNTSGSESVRTAAGTFYVSVKSSVSISDWDSYKAFLLQQEDPFAYLDRKANKSALEAYKDEHKNLPDGLNWSEIRAVNVRRA